MFTIIIYTYITLYIDKHNTVSLSTSRYINASFVDIPSKHSFIATQGPIDSSIEDFWQMVYDYDISLIIMLCSLSEKGRTKCANYWNEDHPKLSFSIKVTSDKKVNSYLKTRTFVLKDKHGKTKQVNQLHFIGWPDHGVPNVNEVYDTFIQMIKIVKSTTKPVAVHCSAGVGRTGTFISMYNLYYELLAMKNEYTFSVFNLVRKLKEMRLFLVENVLQYKFLYGFIAVLLGKLFEC